MAKQIVVNVPMDMTKGVTVEVNGVQGASCTALTEQLEAALGGVVNREHKDEYHQQDQEQRQQQNQ